MKPILVAIAAAAALIPGSVKLRYQYRPGQTFRSDLKERVVGSTRSASIDTPSGSQETHTEMESRVVSVAGGKAVVEEFVKPGKSVNTAPGGIAQEVTSPANKRRVTYGSRGEVFKWERLPVAGVPSAPGFLEGLSIPLPEQPVTIGDVWAGYTNARGFDGKTITIKYNSRYSANSHVGGHACAVIESILISSFTAVEPRAKQKMPGTLSGKTTTYFATDIGQDVKGIAELTIELKESADVVHVLKTFSTQSLIK